MANGANDDITFAQLRAVVAVGRVRSFTRAGDVLRVSQSSVSKAIAGLEERLGITLLDRTTRAVRLTEAGEEFLRHATKVLAEMEAATAACEAAASRPAQTPLDVALSVTVAGAYLPATLSVIESRRSPLLVQCFEGSQYTIENRVVSGESELGICNLNEVHSSLTSRALWSERYHLCVSQKHPLAKQAAIWADQVYDEEFISIANPVRPDLDPLLAATGRVHASRNTVTQYTTAFRLIERGQGVALIPYTATLYAPASVVCPPFGDESISRRIGAVWRRGDSMSKKAEEFISALLKARQQTGTGAPAAKRKRQ